VTALLRGGVVAALGTASLAVALHRSGAQAPVSPRQAAARAEGVAPPLGLVWGKLRGWQRGQDGWWLVWQPAHGAWTVTAWVPDGTNRVRATLAAAPWLPGARLSGEAARLLAGAGAEGGFPTELVGRRDWRFAGATLLGAVRTDLPAQPRSGAGVDPWAAVLVGLALAGAVARTILPTLLSRLWRRATLLAAATLLLSVPALSPLAFSSYRPGVRPWVAELSVVASVAVVLAGVALALYRFPVLAGGAPPWRVASGALACGTMLPWLAPAPWARELAGTSAPVAAVPALAMLLAWFCCLAGDGLRELTGRGGWLVRLVVAGVAAAAVAAPTAAAPLVVAACAGAGSSRAGGAWVTLAVVWGWVTVSLLAGCAWPGAVWLSLALLVMGWAAVAAQAVTGERAPVGEPARR